MSNDELCAGGIMWYMMTGRMAFDATSCPL